MFREIIETKIVPVTVLDQIFRQSKDSLIAYNAKFINEGNTKLFYGPDFVFVSGDSQEDTAEKITERYCLEIQESGIENVQILSPFRSEGAASSEQLNETIRELVNPFRSAEEEIKFGPRIFRVNDRIMQTKNTEKVSNGDLGFIRYIKDTDQGKKIGMDFGAGRTLEYGVDDLSNVDLAYATTIHKAMGSEYETVIMPLLKAHTIMMYRNLLYTGITRAKKRVVLIGQKQVLFMAIHRNEMQFFSFSGMCVMNNSNSGTGGKLTHGIRIWNRCRSFQRTGAAGWIRLPFGKITFITTTKRAVPKQVTVPTAKRKCQSRCILITINKAAVAAADIRWYSKPMDERGICRQKNILPT